MVSFNNETLRVYPNSGQFLEMVLSLCQPSPWCPWGFSMHLWELWFPSPPALAALWTKGRSLCQCQGSQQDCTCGGLSGPPASLHFNLNSFSALYFNYKTCSVTLPEQSPPGELFPMGNCATASGALLISPNGIRCSVPHEKHNYL